MKKIFLFAAALLAASVAIANEGPKNSEKDEQFQKDLFKYSYVTYDTTFLAGLRIHLATSSSEEVKILEDDSLLLIEYSTTVADHLVMSEVMELFYSEYAKALDEINKCFGASEPLNFAQVLANYTQLPVLSTGKNAVYMAFSYPSDVVYKTWIETNFQPDLDVCQCFLNSDVLYKGQARIMDSFQYYLDK